jgi:hypothetical protein
MMEYWNVGMMESWVGGWRSASLEVGGKKPDDRKQLWIERILAWLGFVI